MLSEPGLKLHISNPEMILNEIASRYSSGPRVVMEYLDNSIDDAEDIYRKHKRNYPEPGVFIEVSLDKIHKALLVRDNCRGMSSSQLKRIVQNVGNSSKASSAWLNGRFGFGVHSFRALGNKMLIRTRHRSSNMLEQHLMMVEKSIDSEILPPLRSDELFWDERDGFETGTEVLIRDVNRYWMRSLNVKTMTLEVESHFERMLERPGLRVSVVQRDLGPWIKIFEKRAVDVLPALDLDFAEIPEVESRQCLPLDYSSVNGTLIQRKFKLHGEPFAVHLKVADKEVSGHRARFFKVGRRIHDVCLVPSFILKSKYKQSLWAHPQVLGYIEVPESIYPVITRDEFVAGELRDEFYSHLIGLEDELKDALDHGISQLQQSSFDQLSVAMNNVLKKVSNREKRLGDMFFRTLVASQANTDMESAETAIDKTSTQVPANLADQASDQVEESEHVSKEEEKYPFTISFVPMEPTSDGDIKRSRLVGRVIEINTTHPDFESRIKLSKTGSVVFDDRALAYLSTLISAHYRELVYTDSHEYPEHTVVLQQVIGTFSAIEKELKKQQKSLRA
jgi:hypothetical protein